MSEQLDFALKPGAQPGDSAFLLNTGRHRLAFDPFPGRAIALAFLGSAADPAAEAALAALSANRRLVDDGEAAFFAVIAESGSGPEIALEARFPSIVFLWDGGEMARAFGADRSLVILDPMLRVVDVAPLDEADRVLRRFETIVAAQRRLRPPRRRRFSPWRMFSSLNSAPISSPASSASGGKDSGFMQDHGRAVSREFRRQLETPPRFPSDRPAPDRQSQSAHRAKDLPGDQEGVPDALQPGSSATSSRATMPRPADISVLIATTPGSRSRIAGSQSRSISTRISRAARFRFPNTALQTFKAAPGTAVVFSASILHEVSRVTRGRRYVFLTFLFDEEAERVRQANLRPSSRRNASRNWRAHKAQLVEALELRSRSPWAAARRSPNREVRPYGRPAALVPLAI